MPADLSTTFTGVRFQNPFLLSSAPPTESESNIVRAFEAGWGGVVTKTIGLHPVVNVLGPKTKFLRADVDSARLSMKKRPGAALHSSWNWELISDKTLDWWVPRLGRIKKAYPNHVLVASIMAGSGNDTELRHWQELALACEQQGCDALELNLSCPHMDRPDMGSNVGKDKELVSIVTKVVKEVAKIPVWAKLTPSTTDIVVEARGAFLGGADAIVSSNTFTSLPLIDSDTLEFEVQVDGFVSTGELGGPAILPLSLAKMSQLTQALPDRELLRHRRHLDVRSRPELLSAGVRHGAGLHRRDAGSCDRPEHHQGPERRTRALSRKARRQGMDAGRRLRRTSPRPGRAAIEDPPRRREGLSRRLRQRRLRRADARLSVFQTDVVRTFRSAVVCGQA
jgi:dihydroorotate dehydrogenase